VTQHSIVKITSSNDDLLERALSLFTKVLGAGLYTKAALKQIADAEDSLVTGCLEGAELAGAAMAGRLKSAGVSFYSPFGKDAIELLNGNIIGVLQNSAVEESHRGKGVGTALLSNRISWLTQTGCDYAVGLTWLHGKTTQSDHLYKSAGFQKVGPNVLEFFKSLSQRTGMHCPYCGFPCTCSAAMYAKKLNAKKGARDAK